MKMKAFFRPRNILITIGAVFLVLILGAVAFGIMLQKMPSVGANGADFLRHIFGQEAVAFLEMNVFGIQDSVKKTEYNLNLEKPASPWAAPTSPVKITPTSAPTQAPDAGGPTPQPTPTDVPAWVPPAADKLGALADAGVWQPYINNSAGRVIAYRTFFQVDPTRPYSLTAVVAFNLKEIRLHYMIGFDEPYAADVQRFSQGLIPDKYLKPNVLLAVFNGGFKYEHGQFGSMLYDNVTVPPRDGFGTVAIYKDGHFQIGEWGKEFRRTLDMVAFRQNGPLVVQNGVIDPKVDTPAYWGYTITGATVAWRSGMAVDQDYTTLSYFIGQYITIDSLAKALTAVHTWNGMQLDINNYWTIFDAFPPNRGQLTPEPLLPKDMSDNLNRFMQPYARDFFYVTDANTAGGN